MRMRLAVLTATLALFAPCDAFAQDPAPDDPPPPVEKADPPPPEKQGDPPPKATPSKAKEAEALAGVPYFPLELGRRWRYLVKFHIMPAAGGDKTAPDPDASEGEHHVDVYVAEPVKIGDRKAASLESKLDQVLSQRAYFRVEGGSLRCLKRLQGSSEHVKEFLLAPSQPTLKTTLTVGDAWSWEGKSGASSGTQTVKVLRKEKVTTPAGTFQAVVIEVEYTGEDESRGKTTRWLVKGLGLVKEISSVRTAKHVFRTEGILTRFEKP